MSFAVRAILLAFAMLFAAHAAQAHSPYFTQTEKMVLPDGTTGEIRLLHGDGVMMSDPVRAVIVAAQGHALARTPQSYAMAIRCDRSGTCKAYDLNRLTVSRPDPASFRPGGPVSDVNERWMLIDSGGKPWGFATRRMSLGDAIVGHVVYLLDKKFSTSVTLILAGFAVMLLLGVMRPAPSRRWYDRIVWYAIVIAAFGIAGLLMLMSLLMLWVSGLPLQIWFGTSALSAVAVGFLFWLHRRRAAAVLPS